MKLIKYLLLLVFILGGLPVSQTGDLHAESSSEQTKKKKRKKKKKSSSKKSSSSKKESSSKSKKKKRRKKKKSQKKKPNQRKLNQAKLTMIRISQLQKKTVSILLHMRMSYLISLENYKLQTRNWHVRPGTFTIMNQKSKRLPLSLSHFLLPKISKKNQE